MYKNELKTYKHIYDMGLHQQITETHDLHDCPRCVGPSTNFKFKNMYPMHQFLELMLGNNRSWLRMYDTAGEKDRVEKRQSHLANHLYENDEIVLNNREWPHIIRNYLKYGHKQSYLSIAKYLKFGIDLNEKHYCYADIMPPQPANIQLAI